MMNGPFYRNYSTQQPSRSSRSVPVQQPQQKPSPRVISVPVHFVSSDQPPTTISMLKDSAALKIQKVFRGFVIRKSLRKIASIRNEVTEIERRIDDTEVVNMIRRDAKERLRVNETLMSLLFKLDSIRGVDCGIRDLRKAVTRKAIALQEKVDSIALHDQQTLDSPEIDSDKIDADNNIYSRSTSEQVKEASSSVDETVNNHVNLEAIGDVELGNSNSVEEVVKEVVENDNSVQAVDVSGGVDAMEGMETSPNVDLAGFGGKDDTTTDLRKHKEDREILDSLMGDNEKLMRLMNQISERNEMQTRMINSLSRRVEQLEKVLRSEKLRKKKKTRVSLRRRDKDCLYI